MDSFAFLKTQRVVTNDGNFLQPAKFRLPSSPDDLSYGRLPFFKRKNNPPITKGPAIAANPIKPKTFKTSEVSMAGSVANSNEVNEEFILV